MSTTTETWRVSDEDLFAGDDPIEADDWTGYLDLDFEHHVQLVADRIFNLHQERGVRGEFIFGFDANAGGQISGGWVTLSIPDGPFYLARSVELKHLTNGREATGRDSALAIRDALLYEYATLRNYAISIANSLLVATQPLRPRPTGSDFGVD